MDTLSPVYLPQYIQWIKRIILEYEYLSMDMRIASVPGLCQIQIYYGVYCLGELDMSVLLSVVMLIADAVQGAVVFPRRLW